MSDRMTTAAGQVWIWDWDLARNLLYVDGSAKQALGYGDDELGDSIDSWRQVVHPNDRQRVKASLEAHLRGEPGHRFEIEFRVVAKDGAVRLVVRAVVQQG